MKEKTNSMTVLRRAGQYQDEKIDELLNGDAMALVAVVLAFVVFVGYEWVLWFVPSLRHPLYITIGVFPFIPYTIWKILKVRKQIRKHRRGSIGEKVVADELEKIKREGFMVLHDFQHHAVGNIDHIVIGRKGVFVLETKYRTPEDDESRIFYDGENIYALNSSNNRSLITNDNGKTPCNQAAHAASELQKILTVDFPNVKWVNPVIVFPFWEIKLDTYGKSPNARVCNEKTLALREFLWVDHGEAGLGFISSLPQ